MPFITTRDQTQIYYKQWGEGRPVVLIHGWPLSSDSWDDISYDLSQNGYKVIAYDRRGFGRSDQPASGYDYDTLSDDLADVIKETGIGANDDVSIFGFSMGGGEVVRYMSRHQGKHIAQTGLISSIAPYMAKADDNPEGVEESTLNEMVKGMKKDRAAFMYSFLKDFYGFGLMSNPVSDEALDWSWSMCMQAGLLPTLACADAFAHTDFRPEMPMVNVPTLVIHGTDDKTVPIKATGEQAARKIPNSIFKSYEGAPHGLFLTHQDQLIEDMKEFLGSFKQSHLTRVA